MTLEITKREYIKRYLKTFSINAPKSDKLSNTEINILIAVLFHNVGKSSDQQSSPFSGDGKKLILKLLGDLAPTTYSSNLKKLSKKGLLIALGKKGEYAISNDLLNLMNDLHLKERMSIFYIYKIKEEEIKTIYLDESDLSEG